MLECVHRGVQCTQNGYSNICILKSFIAFHYILPIFCLGEKACVAFIMGTHHQIWEHQKFVAGAPKSFQSLGIIDLHFLQNSRLLLTIGRMIHIVSQMFPELEFYFLDIRGKLFLCPDIIDKAPELCM
jgi:hypothetical protein